MSKIGRNDPCPCKSGLKFKKCCLNREVEIPVEVKLELEKMRAKQEQAKKQQGFGRQILGIKHQGYQFVAVGPRLYFDKNWETFHDFLLNYVAGVMGKEWLEEEFKKPRDQWHPLAEWRKLAFDDLKSRRTGPGIATGPMIGATFAYMHLSYNLYLLAHNNIKLHDRLVERLRVSVGFEDVFYETTVMAMFIRAGFKLELENEQDETTTHCEFTAISKDGEMFSVEAKARKPYKDNVGISNQLYKALKKRALHKRVVFIDLNVPDLLSKHEDIVGELNRQEEKLKVKGNPTDPAYVFVTNHSYTYDLEGLQHERTGFAHGYKIGDFKLNTKFTNLREALKSRESHRAMFDLMKSLNEHREIPATFDGEIPEFAFNPNAQKNRLLIGQKYVVPTPDGDQEGTLETATVMEQKWEIFGVYRLQNGQQIICTNPMTKAEIVAYQSHPDTFFGVPLSVNKRSNDPLELYDFFYESYRKSNRETLLSFLKDDPEYERLKLLSDEEILAKNCERWVYGAMKPSQRT